MEESMPQKNGQGAVASHADGVRGAEPSEQAPVVRQSIPPQPMARHQSAMGGAPNNQPQAFAHSQAERLPQTMHRVSFSAIQVDALAKKQALTELRANGLQVHNEMQFAHAARVIRRDDGGLDVEVGG